MWECPTCSREFTRKNQRHACGTGSREKVIRDRPQLVVEIYHAIEKFVIQLGKVEVVARDRYVLFRSNRIFTDLSIMKDRVRIAIHIGRRVGHPIFIKIVENRGQITHVARIDSMDDLKIIEPYLKEAYEFSVS